MAKSSGEMGKSFPDLLAGLRDFGTTLTRLGGVLSPLAGLAGALASVVQRVMAAEKQRSDAGEAIAAKRYAVAVAEQTASKATTDLQKQGAGLGLAAAKKDLDATEAAAKAGMGLGATISLVAGAAGAAVGAIQSFVGVIERTAGLVSPALMERFNVATQDATAAIGVALLPFLDMMGTSMREAGEIVLPIARQLAPIMQRLADITADRLTASMEGLARIVTALIPLFEVAVTIQEVLNTVTEPVIDVLGALATILAPGIKNLADSIALALIPIKLFADVTKDATVAMTAVTEALAAAFSVNLDLGGIGDRMKTDAERMRESMRELIKMIVLLSMAILKTVNTAMGNKALDALIKRAEGVGVAKEDIRALRPARDARFTDLDTFGKDLLAAASVATVGGGKAETQEDIMKGMLTELQDMRKGGDFVDALVDKLWLKFSELPEKIGKAVWNAIKPPDPTDILPGPAGNGDNAPGRHLNFGGPGPEPAGSLPFLLEAGKKFGGGK